jgi:2-polyprenyl-3-methyl-5-hydroxy-6-metoxy-1,4-benzoquinol methylase
MNVPVKDEGTAMKGYPVACCPACGSAECVDAGATRVPGYRVRRCADCQLVFSDPMKSADSAWYASSWIYGLRESSNAHAGSEGRPPWNFAQALAVLRGAAGNKLLDVGCAEGYFLKLAQKSGCEVTGLDFNPVSVEIARRVLGASTVYQYSVEELGERFPGKQFDVVTVFEVLEHMANPYQTVCSINKLLKAGGTLLLSVPGNRRWPSLFHPEVDAPPHHLTLWTEEALRGLLERAGFRVHQVRAKPLGAEDLGIHLKWRLYQLVASFRARHRCGASANKEIPIIAHAGNGRARPSGIFRELGMLALTPVCWALRLNPEAGGFTLFAHCEKA